MEKKVTKSEKSDLVGTLLNAPGGHKICHGREVLQVHIQIIPLGVTYLALGIFCLINVFKLKDLSYCVVLPANESYKAQII